MEKKIDYNKAFLIYKYDKIFIDSLNDSEVASLFRTIFEYQLSGEYKINLTEKAKMVFLHFKSYFDINTEKYNEKVENSYSKAGKISGIKRSKQYKSLETEEEKERYLNECLTNLTNVKNVQQDIFVSNEKLTDIDIDIDINKDIDKKIDDDIDKNKNHLSSSIINQSFKYKKIETLEKFIEWTNWMSQDNNSDEDFENWIKDNQAPDQLIRDKAEAVIKYYQNSDNKTHDYKEALKKFIKNDLGN